jgi:hypothetical protein
MPQDKLDSFLAGAVWELAFGSGSEQYWAQTIAELQAAGAKLKMEKSLP